MKKCLISFLAVLVFITGCAVDNNQRTIGSSQEYRVFVGVVESMKPIKVESSAGKISGTVAGGVLGGVLGNAIGAGTGRVIATTVGAIGGAVAGSVVGDKVTAHNAYEIIARSDDGRVFSIIEDASVKVFVGQRVRILIGDRYAHVEPY